MSLIRLEEILSAVSDTVVDSHRFEISAPIASTGDLVDIILRPRAATGFYGTRRVTLARLDLADNLTQFVKYEGDASVHALIRRAVLGNYYMYFILSNNRGRPGAVARVLKPLLEDVFDDPIAVSGNNTKVLIRARPESYFFFGQKEITLEL